MLTFEMPIETEEEAQLACAIAAEYKFPRTPDYFFGHTLQDRFNLTNKHALKIANAIALAVSRLRQRTES